MKLNKRKTQQYRIRILPIRRLRFIEVKKNRKEKTAKSLCRKLKKIEEEHSSVDEHRESESTMGHFVHRDNYKRLWKIDVDGIGAFVEPDAMQKWKIMALFLTSLKIHWMNADLFALAS